MPRGKTGPAPEADTDTETQTDTDTETEPEPEPDPETDGDSEPEPEPQPMPVCETSAEPLPASYRGVSEDTITLGTAISGTRPFADLGEVAPRFQAVADTDTTLTATGYDPGKVNFIGLAAPLPRTIAERGLYCVPECLETVGSATGQEMKLNPNDNEPEIVPSTLLTCAQFDLFKAIAEAAGPNLTEETFL